MLDPKASSKLTGASKTPLERPCYAVQDHGDGTSTIVLDWYETSVGRDFMGFEAFMRTDLATAREIVRFLNVSLPGRIDATLEHPAPADDEG